MTKFVILFIIFVYPFFLFAQVGGLLPAFNNSFYDSPLEAAKGVAMPFLLQQQYFTMPDVTVTDTTLIYNNSHYPVYNNYLNPATGYYVNPGQYSDYGIDGFSSIWPNQFPNILFDATDSTFNAQSDCVGYLTRLLSATGDTTSNNNTYLNIINTTHSANVAPFAYRGYVATAYSFAVAFPTFPTEVSAGWQYIAGNVEVDTINAYNHTIVSTLDNYTGVRKGGFGQSLPGDILAFGYSPSSSSNGHIMVMETSPQLLNADSLSLYFPAQSLANAGLLLNHYHIYSMPVFDCSGQMAHFRDSRRQTSGIGHGVLLILTDTTDDAPAGFIFDSLQVTYITPHRDTLGSSVYAISVGRFVTSNTTAIKSRVFAEPTLRVFPNPSGSQLHIILPINGSGSLNIYSAIGSIVFSQQVESPILSPDVSWWASGAYVIQYNGKNGEQNYTYWIKQ